MAYPVMPLGFLGSQGDNDSYRIERSLRFNSADSAYLNRTFGTPTNNIKWTWSGWVKRSTLGSYQNLFCGDDGTANNFLNFRISDNNDRIDCFQISGGSYNLQMVTDARFRDPSAWYHVVLIYDSANATSTDRVQIYVNGTRQTVSYPVGPFAQNTACQANVSSRSHAIGRVLFASTNYLDGYLTEINFIDGQALTPSSFGETDAITGRWKAKAYSGTYGTNGFYLKFADNSGTTSTTLGKDSSPNGNNWTPNNFSVTAGAGNDSLVDSPTNYGTDTGVGGEVRGNYAILNPISNLSGTYSNGNLDFITATSDSTLIANIAMNSGKWYCETIKTSGTAIPIVGICSSFAKNGFAPTNTNQHPSVVYLGNSGNKVINGTSTSYGSTYTTNDVIGIAFDADTREIVFYKNGISQGVITGVPSGEVVFCVGDGDSVNTYSGNVNFGQRPFAYTAPAGFKALCTTNLPTPTIKKSSRYMDVVTYTGNSSTQTISGLGFSPDLVWLKRRNLADSHGLFDSVRGAGWRLQSNDTNAEVLRTDVFTSFDTNGFSITGSDTQSNASGSTYVAWAWDEAPIAGMDIVSYTGNGIAGSRAISHGLGVSPKMIILKDRDSASSGGPAGLAANDWFVWHSDFGSPNYVIGLNSTLEKQTASGFWGSSSPTSSQFTINGSLNSLNENGDRYIAYLFAEVEGFSKFGSYTGNGSADGPFVWCGFRPRWVIVKRIDVSGDSWFIFDSSRNNYNPEDLWLASNQSVSDTTNTYSDFISNGFKVRNTLTGFNTSGGTYIFAAFAESPFKYARAR